MSSHCQNRPFGDTGLNLPHVWFSAGALANLPRVLPEQTKVELIGELLKNVSPVVVDACDDEDAARATAILGRAIRRLEISPDELVVSLRCATSSTPAQVASLYANCSRNLGDNLAPQLVSLDLGDSECDPKQVTRSLEMLQQWKEAGQIRALGICTADVSQIDEVYTQWPLDWLTLRGCLTILHHPPAAVALATRLQECDVPIVISSVLHSGFLAGGRQFDGRTVDPHRGEDQHLLAWRKAFASLCHGHGVSPVHAAIQFALRMPGVFAVRMSASRPDRVCEYVAAVTSAVPANFWASLDEEGLLEDSIK